VVRADGTVGDTNVTQSLDTKFGLDAEAVKAAKQWRFRPAMKSGKPVAVLVTIEIAFSLN
jgi:TonB family protein